MFIYLLINVSTVNTSYTTVNNAAPSGAAASTTATESSTVVYQESYTTNVYVTEPTSDMVSAPVAAAEPIMDTVDFGSATAPASGSGMGANVAALGAGAILAAGGIVAGSALQESKRKRAEFNEEEEGEYEEL